MLPLTTRLCWLDYLTYYQTMKKVINALQLEDYISEIVLNLCHHHLIISLKNIPDDNKHFLKSLASNEAEFQLMNKKG
jgi:hypothetical protein